jgi:glycosyltransferase involved in cell wall biosynthesis
MKIAQIAPLMESVPPTLYGGTERVVSHLCEELVREGHEVTLFATGDSQTAAKLVPCAIRAIRLDPHVQDHVPYYMRMLDRVRRRAFSFDVLHFHIDAFHMPLFRDIASRTVTTLHGRQDIPDLRCLYRAFPEMPLVSISAAQRRPVHYANFAGTVHHGLPLDCHAPNYHPTGNYLAFLGRIAPEKGLDRAIAIAESARVPLKIAAKIDRSDEAYFRETIKPLLNRPGVEFIGEIGEREKTDFLGNARALLFPIDWPEPFGLVMIEAMACGTPVLAFRRGSVPEIIDDGITGRIVDTIEEADVALLEIMNLDRREVRRRFEGRFSAARMAEDYLGIYRSLRAERADQPDARRAPMNGAGILKSVPFIAPQRRIPGASRPLRVLAEEGG